MITSYLYSLEFAFHPFMFNCILGRFLAGILLLETVYQSLFNQSIDQKENSTFANIRQAFHSNLVFIIWYNFEFWHKTSDFEVSIKLIKSTLIFITYLFYRPRNVKIQSRPQWNLDLDETVNTDEIAPNILLMIRPAQHQISTGRTSSRCNRLAPPL